MSPRTNTLLAVLLALALAAACSDDTAAVDGGPWPDGLVLDGAPDSWTGDGAPPPACAPGPALLAKVDPARMLKDIQFLVGLGERWTHASQSQAAAYIKAELAKLAGVQLQEQSYQYSGLTYVNLEATIPGTQQPDAFIFAGAHYDCASGSPGADDNASGVATALEIARALAGCPLRRSARLLFFSNEDKGLVGAKAYVASIKGTLPTNKLLGHIAIDMVAYGPDDEDLDLGSKVAYSAFVDETATAVEQWTPLKTKKIISDLCG